MIRFFSLLAVCWTQAASAEVPARLEQAFRGWVAETDISRAVITIWQKETARGDVAVGMDPDTPVELASLGKAITGLCAAHLIREGIWTLTTDTKAFFSFPHDPLTVAELMTHATGLAPDQTQDTMPGWLDDTLDRSSTAARMALTRRQQRGVPGQFAYNNENYAILAAMIAVETGAPHNRFCEEAVLKPAGAHHAKASPRTGAFAGWGGWQMPVQDYARLMYWGFGPDGIIGADPDAWPQAEMGGGVSYGVGMTQRRFRGKMNYWHFGLLCFPGRLDAGAFAVSWEGNWRVVVAYDKCTTWEEMLLLDRVLTEAVYK